MTWSRFLGASTAALVVGGCALVALGMAHADRRSNGLAHDRRALVSPPSRAVYLPVTVAAPATSAAASTKRPRPAAHSATTLRASASPLHHTHPSTAATTWSAPTPAATPAPAPSTRRATSSRTPAAPPSPTRSTRTASPTPSTTPSPTRTKSRRHPPVTHRPRGRRLPLHLRTHDARQVITVVARSRTSTTATLQAWRKARGGGWLRRGPRIHAHIGADGMSWHASESKSATPMGSFTLTHTFGHDGDPGTALPYLHTNPSDWWISQPGRLYNTHQRCSGSCPFTQGNPNEHLYYETPYYNYAAVIDYNTRNAPGGVHQGKGSAFFLHVTVGQPTAGCVAIPQGRLVSILRWLKPARHPRILIGVS